MTTIVANAGSTSRLMSPPTKQLGKLSIGGNMSATRSQVSGGRTARSRNDDEPSDCSDHDHQDDDDDNDGYQLGYATSVASLRNSPNRDGLSREDKVRDIMSAFNECIFPEEFRPDLVETTRQPRTPEQCVVQGDFEATMFRLSVHDDNVYTSLRKAMPTGACAAIYFDKAERRSRKIFAAFDLYRETGKPQMEVEDVAELLRRLVEQIRVNIFLRIPYGLKGAAGALVALLQEICNRNIDAFEGNRWGRVPRRDGEDEDDRNLYEQLIGQPGFQGYFILDVLADLPSDLLRHYVSNLNEILNKLQINRAPRPYILTLKKLIRNSENDS